MSLLGGLLGAVAAPFTGGASLVPALVGAGLGAAKHAFVDKPAEERSAKLSAEIMRYSPWTGMQAPAVKKAPGLFSSMIQGGAMGATAGNLASKAAGAAAPAAASISGAAPSLGVASEYGKQLGDMAADTAASVGRTVDFAGGPAPSFMPKVAEFKMPQLGASLNTGPSAWNLMGGQKLASR
jgi:hypothetical protein